MNLTTFGPLASPAQRERVKAYIDQGIKAGARAILKGAIQETNGCYVGPTIFDHVDSRMSILREEISALCFVCRTSTRMKRQSLWLTERTTALWPQCGLGTFGRG